MDSNRKVITKPKISSYQWHILCFAIVVLLETALLTFWRNKLGIYVSPIVSMLLSIGIAAYPLVLTGKYGIAIHRATVENNGKVKGLSWLLFLAGGFIIALELKPIINEFAISVKHSDILPTINIYIDRLLTGDPVYEPFDDFGYTLYPNYLPMQWLPFAISRTVGFDHRWMAFAILAIALIFYQYRILKNEASLPGILIKTLAPFFILHLFIADDPGIFGMTIETMIAGYYLLLFLSISSNSTLFKAVGIVICLLSRFSFLIWLPLYFLVFLVSEGRKKTLLISVSVIVGILIIYVIPFMSQDWLAFFRGYNYYTDAALGEWIPQYWQQPDEKPFQLFRGVGFAAYFYDFAEGALRERLLLLKNFHIGLSLLSVMAAAIFYFLNKKVRAHPKLFLLAALKFYFAFFYGFIQVPYVYLNLVPVFLSVYLFSCIPFGKKTFQKDFQKI